ncbi:anhydro-N-acetylmuramic acid kinase [Clostridium cavendishii DSM 21758]|uniref:Anhydro-N-acetylmuramic acid kinase n=1 Tax=Clostridium cavendishii DSM 21758 TaxID=1121302 RepID=A0A1M6UPI9_9CLOT|nr:anhydro-N-acetylmuramic acid kinase AnmK [Clostridium cavendishii]SHK71081.1 anhydro-N-acetylmuramic acid kinase [Clostridium cavendishii DSM 21758]
MDIKYSVGIMSGTSLDGIDVALVKIKDSGINTKLDVVGFETIPFEEDLREEIKRSLSIEKSNVELICSLNFKLGYAFSNAVKVACNNFNFDLSKIDFIGSHGQTVYHIPKDTKELKKSTLQIGEPSIIAYEIGCQVVSNFRSMDMAAGGEGAPLVPFTEYILYRSSKNRVLQNIGGIGNATIIPQKCKLNDVFAFDTGPGNMIIDEVVYRLTGMPYDKGGQLSLKGKIIEPMLKDLMEHEYILRCPPKSTGREVFGSQFVDKILKQYSSECKEDIICTVTMFTAKSIEYNYRNFIMPRMKIDEVIIGGGGSYNKTLLNMIRECMPECKVLTQEDLGFSSDSKEAIAFAILANETLHGSFSNVLTATGAKEYVILGNITPTPKKFN